MLGAGAQWCWLPWSSRASLSVGAVPSVCPLHQDTPPSPIASSVALDAPGRPCSAWPPSALCLAPCALPGPPCSAWPAPGCSQPLCLLCRGHLLLASPPAPSIHQRDAAALPLCLFAVFQPAPRPCLVADARCGVMALTSPTLAELPEPRGALNSQRSTPPSCCFPCHPTGSAVPAHTHRHTHKLSQPTHIQSTHMQIHM